MGRGVPFPNGLGVWGSVVSGAEPRPKTNLVYFVAARRTLIAIIRVIVSAVMDVETHTAKHEEQKCDQVYMHTLYTIDVKNVFLRFLFRARFLRF